MMAPTRIVERLVTSGPLPATVPWTPMVAELDGCAMSGELMRILLRCSSTWRAYLAACKAYGRAMPIERLIQAALDVGDHSLASMIMLADELGLLAEELH